jgi:hypothetical protein
MYPRMPTLRRLRVDLGRYGMAFPSQSQSRSAQVELFKVRCGLLRGSTRLSRRPEREGNTVHGCVYSRNRNLQSPVAIAQSASSPASASPQTGTGNGLKLLLAFLAGGVVFSIIGAMLSSTPAAAPPAPPPAAVSAPVAPPLVTPAKRRVHGSKRASAPGLPHPPVTKATHTPQTPPDPTSDAAPPAKLGRSM